MLKLTGSGEYKSKKTGNTVPYTFEFQAFESIDDASSVLGADKVLKDLNRMSKLDANNTAREKAKVANGDSERKVMTEQEKAEAKAERQANKGLLTALKAKAEQMGVSVDELLASL